MDARVWDLLPRLRAACEAGFGENLLGAYAHGSLALGGFRWAASDIDLLVVVSAPPALESKMAFVRALLVLEADCPPKGLEMSVVLAEACAHPGHPAPFELHGSPMHWPRFREDLAGACAAMQGEDPDLAAHFAVAREAGIALCGPAARMVFAPVPREMVFASVWQDVASARESIHSDPVYTILNLCRTLAFARDGRMRSKAAGGAWGEENVLEFAPLIRAARRAYERGEPFAADGAACAAFAEAMLGRIEREWEEKNGAH